MLPHTIQPKSATANELDASKRFKEAVAICGYHGTSAGLRALNPAWVNDISNTRGVTPSCDIRAVYTHNAALADAYIQGDINLATLKLQRRSHRIEPPPPILQSHFKKKSN